MIVISKMRSFKVNWGHERSYGPYNMARDIKINTNFYRNSRERMKLRGHNKFDARIILRKKISNSHHLVGKKQLTVETADFSIRYSI